MPDVHRNADLPPGPGRVTVYDGSGDAEVGVSLDLVRLAAGQQHTWHSATDEAALVVLSGKGRLRSAGQSLPFARSRWVSEAPCVAHAPADSPVGVEAEGATEVILVRTPNPARFAPRLLGASSIRIEQRGEGRLEGAAHRIVRTAFDASDSPLESRLVVGEVVAFQGRWSSYPPHHHPQPELYFYRFDPPQGYGHAECGEAVYKVRGNDVLRIAPGKDHAQCAAPGYAMYYLWAVRHLEGARYAGFEVSPAHAWTLA